MRCPPCDVDHLPQVKGGGLYAAARLFQADAVPRVIQDRRAVVEAADQGHMRCTIPTSCLTALLRWRGGSAAGCSHGG
jgi:hypothetical protein